MWMKDIAALMAKEFRPQGYSVVTCQVPYFFMWVAGLFNRQIKNIIPRLGKEYKLDNSRVSVLYLYYSKFINA